MFQWLEKVTMNNGVNKLVENIKNRTANKDVRSPHDIPSEDLETATPTNSGTSAIGVSRWDENGI